MDQANSPAPISIARPVPRKMTMVGGWQVDTSGMPALQSGATSAGGVVPTQADNPKAEALAEVHALIGRLSELASDIATDRFVVADESARSALRRLGNVRDYLQHLALKQQTPFTCPRCQTAKTHDAAGRCFCAGCVSASYGRPKL